jgi:hypothetical protein
MKRIIAQDTVLIEMIERNPGIIDAMRRECARRLTEEMVSEGLVLFSQSTSQDQFGDTHYTMSAAVMVGPPKAAFVEKES